MIHKAEGEVRKKKVYTIEAVWSQEEMFEVEAESLDQAKRFVENNVLDSHDDSNGDMKKRVLGNINLHAIREDEV